MLSLHTNAASLSALSALGKSSKDIATSQSRLSTGYRINSAMDDAAGLQIATRLQAQSQGMAVAMRNTQNDISMLQTADALLEEVGNMLMRIGDLATQAADASSSQADRDAMHAEYLSLSEEILKVVNDTPYNGEPLLRYTVGDPGKFGTDALTFQIGASATETVTTDFRPKLGNLNGSLYYAINNGNLFNMPQDGPDTELTSQASANLLVNKVKAALDDVGALRAQLGATSNRLDSVYRNLSTMQLNTKAARGRIVDTDYAGEAANATQQQMLMQSGTAMLKQSNSVSQMVMGLIQQ
jgi:flagellin